jgi:signal transduction histidine kinase
VKISFHARLFGVASAIVGLALAAVIALGWNQVMAFEIDRLDEQLCAEARRLTHVEAGPKRLDRLAADMGVKLRLQHKGQLLLGAWADQGTPLLQWRQDGPGQAELMQLEWSRRAHNKSPLGRLAAGLQAGENGGTGTTPPAQALPAGTCLLAALPWQGTRWRAARVNQDGVHGWVAADLAAQEQELREGLTEALAMIIPIALAMTALGAWLLAGYTIGPVNRLREAMRRVTTQALSQRLPSLGEDREFEELIAAYNTMLARLEISFHQASRFSADAAHELRTPLTILQGRLECALQRLEVDSLGGTLGIAELQDELCELLDEVGRLSGITRKLLLLSQADGGRLSLQLEEVDLSRVLHECLDDACMALPEESVVQQIQPSLRVMADTLLLRQLLNNLFSNAMRYRHGNGPITVEARREGPGLVLTMSNPCLPLSEEQRGRLFDRFYRADAAHSRRVDGTGLGLSLSREIARAHGGDLRLADEASGSGLFRIRLQLPAAADRAGTDA